MKRTSLWLPFLLGLSVLAHAQSGPTNPGASPPRQLTVYDRLGSVVRTLGKPGNYVHPAISPDGTRLAVVDNQTGDIWVFDMSTGAGTRVTTSPELDWAPVWSPDGSEVAYSSVREGSTRLYRKDSSGTGIETLLYQRGVADRTTLTDWSGDGRLSFHSGDVLYVLPLNGERKEVELIREEFSVQAGRFSPDNRLFSYSSDETGQVEAYVRPFDTSSGVLRAGPKWKVPGAVGRVGMVQWRHDGKELLYLEDGALNAVDVSIDQGFEAGTPKRLFGAPGLLQRAPDAVGSISRDGQLVVFAVPPQRKEKTVAHETLSKYVGTYVADGPTGSAVVVTFDGHQLIYQFQNGGQSPLAAESDTYFFFRNINGDIEFFIDDSGGVTHLLIHQGGGPGPKWLRK